MKIKLKKVKAFSLNEMMVVLLLTAIIVGMAFSVLRLVQKQMGGIEGIYEVKLEANKLRQSLWLDFNHYSNVHYDAKKEMISFSNELGTKQYKLLENQMVVERDTFEIQLETAVFYFNNAKIFNGEIDAIEIKTTKEAGNQQIFVYKDNAADTYINR